MKFSKNKKYLMLVTTIICVALIGLPVCNAGFSLREKIIQNTNIDLFEIKEVQSTSDTEYWALLFAVGEYLNNPEQDRPSMLVAVENLYDVLLDSPQWQEDHIHKVKASDATGKRLIQELRWLARNADSDDLVLVYLTTHGTPLLDKNENPIDIPPKDEEDGADECLIMYEGFDNGYSFIWDDLLNFFLNRINCQGLCLIVDSCYSGGFNDVSAYNMISNSQPVNTELNVNIAGSALVLQNFVNSKVKMESLRLYQERISYSISWISSSCSYFFLPNKASLIAFNELLSYAPPKAYPEILRLKKKLNRSI